MTSRKESHRSWIAPPNWPTPTIEWTPSSGWMPEPIWGAPPEGWVFWQGEARIRDADGSVHRRTELPSMDTARELMSTSGGRGSLLVHVGRMLEKLAWSRANSMRPNSIIAEVGYDHPVVVAHERIRDQFEASVKALSHSLRSSIDVGNELGPEFVDQWRRMEVWKERERVASRAVGDVWSNRSDDERRRRFASYRKSGSGTNSWWEDAERLASLVVEGDSRHETRMLTRTRELIVTVEGCRVLLAEMDSFLADHARRRADDTGPDSDAAKVGFEEPAVVNQLKASDQLERAIVVLRDVLRISVETGTPPDSNFPGLWRRMEEAIERSSAAKREVSDRRWKLTTGVIRDEPLSRRHHQALSGEARMTGSTTRQAQSLETASPAATTGELLLTAEGRSSLLTEAERILEKLASSRASHARPNSVGAEVGYDHPVIIAYERIRDRFEAFVRSFRDSLRSHVDNGREPGPEFLDLWRRMEVWRERERVASSAAGDVWTNRTEDKIRHEYARYRKSGGGTDSSWEKVDSLASLVVKGDPQQESRPLVRTRELIATEEGRAVLLAEMESFLEDLARHRTNDTGPDSDAAEVGFDHSAVVKQLKASDQLERAVVMLRNVLQISIETGTPLDSNVLGLWRRMEESIERSFAAKREVSDLHTKLMAGALHEAADQRHPEVPVGAWKQAEGVAASALRRFGFGDAQVTGNGTDGGIDILGRTVAAQVKYTMRPVGRPAVQQLVGAAGGRTTAFFSSAGFSAQAIEFANQVGMALFLIRLPDTVTPMNNAATSLVRGRMS